MFMVTFMYIVGKYTLSSHGSYGYGVYFRSTPHPVTVTTRIITYLVGNPYKPSFATVTGWGVDPRYGVYSMLNLHYGGLMMDF